MGRVLMGVVLVGVMGVRVFGQELPGGLDGGGALQPGAADSIEERLRARRAMQAGEAPVMPAGRGAMNQGRGGGFGGPPLVANAAVDFAAAKKNAPVILDGDAKRIEMSDKVVTQVIPVQHIDAVRLRNDITPFLSADADVSANAGSNSIVISDISSRVHRIAELVSAMDQLGATPGAMARGVARGNARVVDSVPGTYLARVIAPVAAVVSPADRRVVRVHVAEGQAVKAGQVLFELDAGEEAAEVAIAEARLAGARGRLENVGNAGTFQFERAQGAAEVAANQGAVDLCRRKLEGMQIKAPFDGVLGVLDIKAGQVVRAGATLTQVVGSEDVKVAFEITAEAAAEVKLDQKIVFTTGGDPGYAAVVSFISPMIDAGTGTTAVRARLLDVKGVKVGSVGVVRVKP